MRIRVVTMSDDMRSTRDVDTALLTSLFWESEKCVKVEALIEHFKPSVSYPMGKDPQKIIDLLEELRTTMLSFADLFPLNVQSIHGCLNHLEMVMPSISETLHNLMDQCLSRRFLGNAGWHRLLYVMSGRDQPGLELWDRLKLYIDFFNILFDAMVQASNFEWKRAEDLRVQIMDLREDDGMRLPKDLQTVFVPFNHLPAARARRRSFLQHWAIETMDRRPKTITKFDTQVLSKAFDVYGHWNSLGIPEKSKLLFQRTFRNDANNFKNAGICFTVFINHVDRLPYLLLRTVTKHGPDPYYHCQPLNEIRIRRSETKLNLSRWSYRDAGFVYLAVLHFDLFEELVVIHCTLLSLKAQTSLLPQAISHDESVFRDDSKILERAMDITDNGVRHKMYIYRDNLTGTKRLYACVAKGERLQAHAPAWTVFFSDRKVKPKLECIGDYTLIIHNAVLYTFGDRYLTPRHDARYFEIHFKHSRDNRNLKYMFDASFEEMRRRAARRSF